MEVRFETEADLQREREVIEVFAKATNSTYVKLGDNEIDFKMERGGKVVAYVEVKTYTADVKDYDTQVIAIKKLTKMQVYDKIAPCFWVMRFAGGEILYIRVKDVAGYTKWGGRKPREGSTNDQELLLYCKKDRMTVLKSE